MPVFKLKGGGTTSSGWKSERQKLQVLGRLASAGVEVSDDTPPSKAWALLTDLLTDEVAGRKTSRLPKLPPLPKSKKKGFVEWSLDD